MDPIPLLAAGSPRQGEDERSNQQDVEQKRIPSSDRMSGRMLGNISFTEIQENPSPRASAASTKSRLPTFSAAAREILKKRVDVSRAMIRMRFGSTDRVSRGSSV